MTRHAVTITARPLRLAQRLWYRRLGIPAPLAEGSTGPWHANWFRLLPQRWRRLHHAYAVVHGFFWLPCVLCDQPYGGHQYAGSVPDPTSGPGVSIGICPACTRAGRSVDAWHPVEDLLNQVADRHEHGHDRLTEGCARCIAWDVDIRALLHRGEDDPRV